MLYKPFNYIDEVWAPITNDIVPGIVENKYIVSNYGFISNIDYSNHGQVYSFNYLGQFNNRAYVNLSLADGSGILALVSRIVAKCFVPGYAIGLEVNHKDGNPINNYYRNLEWVTRSENIRHAYDNNLIQSLVDEETVHKICKLLEEDKLSAIEIAVATGLDLISSNPIALISAIKKGKLWCHISKNYKIPLGRHGRIFNDDQINEICSILEKDGINTTTIDIVNKLGIEVNGSMQKYNNIISAIKHKRRYTYISNNYTF